MWESHLGWETTPAYDILQLIYSSDKLIVLRLQVSVGTLY